MVATMAKQQDLFGAPPRCFENDAYGFLIAYVKRVQGPFCSEDVTLAAIAKGIAPADLRSWGSLHRLRGMAISAAPRRRFAA